MLTGLYLFLNRCECGISRYGFCHYCGDNIYINVIIFILVFCFVVYYLNKLIDG